MEMKKLWEPGEKYFSSRLYGRRRFRDENRRGYRFLKKLILQSVAAFLLFWLIWGIFQVNSPLVEPVQSKLRSCFTEDYNVRPVLEFFYNAGLWGDTIEQAAFEASRIPSSQVSAEPGLLTVPVSGQIITSFGWEQDSDQVGSFRDGVTIAAAEGTYIRAALSGTVTRIGNEEIKGRLVEITDDDGYITKYAHLQEILVNFGDTVQRGQVIGKVGATGEAKEPQLYFMVEKEGVPLDPVKLFMPENEET